MARDLDQYTGISKPSFYPASGQASLPQESIGTGVRKQIDYMASHMFLQLKEHEAAQVRTATMFEQLLRQLEETVVSFQQSFMRREVPIGSVYARIDADRSVGILHLLWHVISFTTRGNTKPMALRRNGREHQFTGRIVAIMGDFQENLNAVHSHDFADLLDDELASLYIPASPTQPAVMTFRHTREELFFHQAEPTQQFLLKILESVWGGGYFHENAME